MITYSSFDASGYIKECASANDSEIDLALLSMAMVHEDHKGLSFDRYIHHVSRLSDDAGARYRKLVDAGSVDNALTKLAAIKHIIIDSYDYHVDLEGGEILENYDLVRVIDRRKGSSASLCVLCMDVARKQGWDIKGLNVPSRFLCRMECSGQFVIFDSTQGCRILQAHHLRKMVKEKLGKYAELSTEYLNGLGARDTVIYLCNQIKFRRIEMGEYDLALEITNRMRILAPDEYRLLLDAGVLLARTKNIEEAKLCLEQYIEKAENYYDRQEAKMLLVDIDSDPR